MPGRFDRLRRLPQIGDQGGERLTRARIAVVGCGALGSHLSETLARCGVSSIYLIDRDVVEPSNLDRQTLYDEEDARCARPKAVAAAEKLRKICSGGNFQPFVADLDSTNAAELLSGAELILDGTDNFATRFLLNDFSVARGVPWIHAGVVGVSGCVLPVLPRRGPCYRCYLPEEPPPGAAETCDVAGVLPTAVAAIAALAATSAIAILVGRENEVATRLATVDIWRGRMGSIAVPRREDCSVCVRGQYDYLSGLKGTARTRLCGQRAVQVRPLGIARPDLAELAGRLAGRGLAEHNAYMVRFEAEGKTVSLFSDGRAIIHGTDDPAAARSLYARYVGL
ncbi:MAG: ThiF family adenylyltransferase [Planctomycetes bacterium]|nr:ThiF family adenylyltransferase [Planctomycetota bacterium]